MIVNDYANSMFRFDVLNNQWIDSCARYLNHIFGESIKGAVVCDYGFGRGNWSLAFVRAGAAKVYSVDGSKDNCSRFNKYINENNIKNIDILCADFSDATLNLKSDISWVYGIFHHLLNEKLFLSTVIKNTTNKGDIFLYSYDADSLRDLIVSFARKYKRYDSEQDFRLDSYLFSQQARMRVRDDLTAPVVRFYSAEYCVKLMSEYGYTSYVEAQSFDEFLGREMSVEFNPHHFLFSRTSPRKFIKYSSQSNQNDLNIIKVLLNDCNDLFMSNSGAIYGLLNTHFSSVYHLANPFIEDFKFLMYLCLSSNHQLDGEAVEIASLFKLGTARGLTHEMVPNRFKGTIFNYIVENGIRL